MDTEEARNAANDAADGTAETPDEMTETSAEQAEPANVAVEEAVAEPVEESALPAEETPAELEAAARAEIGEGEPEPPVERVELGDAELRAILEAIIYITDEPLEARQIALSLDQALPRVEAALAALVTEYSQPERGLQIREIAGGYKMATKPEHHEAVRQFVKNLKPSFKLTPAALETLAVIAYKQPITGPEIMEIRGVQGAGVLKTLLDRKLITTAGRKSVIGKPILYKTTKDFLIQFGLKSVNELPTLKEFEELRRLAFSEDEVEEVEGPASIAESQIPEDAPAAAEPEPAPAPAAEPMPEPAPESQAEATPHEEPEPPAVEQ